MITKRILDLGVNLTVGELLASAPAVEKQLTKANYKGGRIKRRFGLVVRLIANKCYRIHFAIYSSYR